ncbi:MAG TPA: HEAT repeat domain-containing protein, partial [Pirellulales bacterium]|nr:HEAT repeat domain-containing protein [Pirellulales bacterium]
MLWRTVWGPLVLGSLVLLPSEKSTAADTPDGFLPLVVKLIGDNDREFRAAGLDQVRSRAGGLEGTKLFAGRLPQLDSAGQAALMSALADRGDPAARPAIILLLNSSTDENVRIAAIRALGKLGKPADLPWLMTYLSSKSAAEQAAVQATLTDMRGEKITKALAAELSSVPHANKA